MNQEMSDSKINLYIESNNQMHNVINNKVIDLDEVLGQGRSMGINTTTGVS